MLERPAWLPLAGKSSSRHNAMQTCSARGEVRKVSEQDHVHRVGPQQRSGRPAPTLLPVGKHLG